jgi:large conductance mechanosensitive channel
LSEFRKFVLRGNVVDLAIAVVVGAAFGTVVTALVKDLITPLLGAIGGQPDFSRLTFTINNSRFMYGDFLNAAISFFLMATALFFLVVQPINHLQTRIANRKTPEEPADRKCPECLSEIPKAASRCKFCTAKVQPLKKL